jgi:hypothetical protein
LKLDIAVSEDVIRPESTVLLDLKLTNVAHDAISLPAGSPDFWSYNFEPRNAQGALVTRTAEFRAISLRPQVVTLSLSIPLAAGASLTKTVMLEKLFDLSKPGRYSLRISFTSFACGTSGARVTSNLIHFTVGDPSDRPLTSQSGMISIAVSVPRARVPVGWGVPLDIIVENKSGRALRWASDDPPNIAPDEFLTGVQVFGTAGEVCPPPEPPNSHWSASRFRDTVSEIVLPPGKSAEQIIVLGDLFDIGKPGRYRAKAVLVDPISSKHVESDTVSFEIVAPSSSPSVPKEPPFVVTLRSVHFERPDPSSVLICMSNISDHDIRLDNSALKDFCFCEGI